MSEPEPTLTPGELLGHSVRSAGAVVSWLSILGGVVAMVLGLLQIGAPGTLPLVAVGIAAMVWGWWVGAISRGLAYLLEHRP